MDPPDGGGGGGGGLTIEWHSKPAVIPSEPSSDRTIERAVFLLDDLRVVGEAGPFDLMRDKLEWSRGIVPTPLPVTGALPGNYSRFLLELDGDSDEPVEYAFEITGTVKVNDVFQPFTIHDTTDVTLMLEFSLTLAAGVDATIPVQIELDRIVNAVNFQSVPFEGGRYLVDKDSSQISAVRAAVLAAVHVSGPS